ncbi:MAG: hypothetical protein KYX69_19705 [Sphingomonas sp.]|uniref:hypothetical protein n=1 Tax=Sphingomonas sp. TaxID=28214 RepID=UPI0026061D20|nr:hypothetical protein [Sphingomonas sp.]MDK2769930.1 hypothetical protein [Sphingomonas sp.]
MTASDIACLECETAVSDARKGQGFCCDACRSAFNNRRKRRGADAYDIFRALRRERSTAKRLNLWTELCRLELKWQMEDEAERPGRRSYVPPDQALANLYDKGALQRGDILVNSYFSGRSSAR